MAMNLQDQVDDQECLEGARFSLGEQGPGSPLHTGHPRPTWTTTAMGLKSCQGRSLRLGQGLNT